MDAPVVTLRSNTPRERALKQYNVKLWVPECEACNGKYAVLKHSTYIELFIALPILCLHKLQVKNVSVEQALDNTVVTLPDTWQRVLSDFASDLSGASLSGAKLDSDLVRVAGKGKVAAEHNKQLYAMALAGRYNLEVHPQLEPQELARLLALTEKATEEAVVDLGLVRNELYGPPPDSNTGGQSEVAKAQKKAQETRAGQANQSFGLGARAGGRVLDRLRESEENLANDDSAFELLGPELLDASLVGGEVVVRNRDTAPPIPVTRNQPTSGNTTPAPTTTLTSQQGASANGGGGPPINSTQLSVIQEEDGSQQLQGLEDPTRSPSRHSTPSARRGWSAWRVTWLGPPA